MQLYNNRERSLTIDILNILSCLAVIALHHNGLVHSYDGSPAWKESLVAECVFYWCVPVFFMISGATLMEYRNRYSTSVFLKRRFLRTVVPWFLWSAIFLFWKVQTDQIVIEDRSVLKQCLEMIVNNKVMQVYWFFNVLFACYLVIPVFSILGTNRKVLWYVVGLNFIFSSVLPTVSKWLDFSYNLSVPVVGSCMIYILLGYLLKDITLNKKQRYLLYIIGFGMMIFRYVYTYHFSSITGITDTSIKGFQVFHAVLYSVAIWILGWNINWRTVIPKWLQDRLPTIASCSLGVYLTHIFVMYYEKQLLSLNNHSFIWRTICILLTYIASLMITLILKKIPIIRILVP